MNLRQVLFVLTLFLIVASSGNAKENLRNGNWWCSQDRPTKYYSVADALEGLTIGPNLSAFGLTVSLPLKPAFANSHNSPGRRFISISGAQLVDGLDKFYSDNRNSAITISNAVTVVVHRAAGTPRKTVLKMIEEFRKAGC